MLKKYKFGIDTWAIWIIAVIMLPNIIWALSDLPDDILKRETLTPSLDNVMTISQVLMILALCLIRNKETKSLSMMNSLPAISVAMCMLYYSAWIFYFSGGTDGFILTALCVTPCVALILYCLFRKNVPAMFLTLVFSVLHILRTVLNFIV